MKESSNKATVLSLLLKPLNEEQTLNGLSDDNNSTSPVPEDGDMLRIEGNYRFVFIKSAEGVAVIMGCGFGKYITNKTT